MLRGYLEKPQKMLHIILEYLTKLQGDFFFFTLSMKMNKLPQKSHSTLTSVSTLKKSVELVFSVI